MKSLLFATTNERKVREARAACEQFEIKLEPIKLDILEIQAHDPKIIAADKIEKAFALTQKPVVITDTSWNIPALSGFPGGLQWMIMTKSTSSIGQSKRLLR